MMRKKEEKRDGLRSAGSAELSTQERPRPVLGVLGVLGVLAAGEGSSG
jgi:hypothetical protein